jgi:hypothetical protein
VGGLQLLVEPGGEIAGLPLVGPDVEPSGSRAGQLNARDLGQLDVLLEEIAVEGCFVFLILGILDHPVGVDHGE